MNHPAATTVQRILLIGTGSIGAAHVESALKVFPHLELHATDVNPDSLNRFCERFGQVRPHRSLDDLLSLPAQADDIVIVATPPKFHADLSIAALRSGRHVLCEKPLAMSSDQARLMAREARAAGRILACCSSRFLGSPSYLRARELIHDGTLGSLYHATWVHREQRSRTGIEYQPATPWFVKRSVNGGGVLMDWGPYDLSILCHLLDPTEVTIDSAFAFTPETKLPPNIECDVEFHVSATMRFVLTSGHQLTVTLERASCTHGGERKVAEFEGTKGALTWNWLTWNESPPIHVTTDLDNRATSRSVEPGPHDGFTPHDRPVLHLSNAIQGRPHCGVHNEDAVFNFLLLQAVYDVAASGRPRTLRRADIAAHT